MKKYIYMLNERDLYAKTIASAQKGDTVYLIYSKERGQISVNDLQLYTNAKCKIQFMQTPEDVPEETAIAFTLGKIVGSTPDVIVGSKDTLINLLLGNTVAEKKTRKQKEPKTTTQEKVPTQTAAESKNKTKTNTQPVKPASNNKISATDFDKAYDDLSAYLTKIKTKDCDPSANINGIVKAVTTMESEKISFDKAIALYVSSATAKKLTALIHDSVLTDITKKALLLKELDR